ncbi:hypothetical protein CEQ90_06040 [Lewinellaceae bacterium SD302]|nr:hypothetical protein CEQ90_06040 [Lewinellaceae bacterium SD302]
MTSFNRFKLLLLRTWQLSPRWYFFLPAVTFLGINTFGILVDGSDGFPRFQDTDEVFLSPSILLMLFTYASTISLTIIGVHLVSRHFRNDQLKTDSLTLPVSNKQLYVMLLLSCFIFLPFFGIISNTLIFGIVKLIGLYGLYPRWAWMWPIFSIAVLPYMMIMIPFIAFALIQSKQTILWGLGVFAAGAIIIATIANWNPDFMNSVNLEAENIGQLAKLSDDVYGPTLGTDSSVGISPFFATFSNGWSTSIFFLLVTTGLLLASGWFALKNREV